MNIGFTEKGITNMIVLKLDKNYSTFGGEQKDLRPHEQAWAEDFPKSKLSQNKVIRGVTKSS